MASVDVCDLVVCNPVQVSLQVVLRPATTAHALQIACEGFCRAVLGLLRISQQVQCVAIYARAIVVVDFSQCGQVETTSALDEFALGYHEYFSLPI